MFRKSFYLSTINNSTFKNILICISNTREWRLALLQALKLFHLIPPIRGDSTIPTLQIRKITQEDKKLSTLTTSPG